jgi:hypothetical protein
MGHTSLLRLTSVVGGSGLVNPRTGDRQATVRRPTQVMGLGLFDAEVKKLATFWPK